VNWSGIKLTLLVTSYFVKMLLHIHES